MDLLTQGALGAALSQASCSDKRQIVVAGLCGFLAGLAPDLDALIRSPTDPLIFLKYHRHFTHSLFFIPLGGVLTALCIHTLLKRKWSLTYMQTFLYCTLGFATHGLLDATTSYGTSLLWPFSDARISWNLVSIIDPLFTVPLAALVLLSVFKRQPSYARAGLCWALLYLTAAGLQHGTALDMARELAAERGHVPTRIEAKPSFGNILVWKTIYERPESFHIDAVRAGIAPTVFEGTLLPKLNLARDLPWLDTDSQQSKDIERFRSFSLGYIAQSPQKPNRLIDIRYSFVPNDVNALWSIEVSPDATTDDHAKYLTHRDNPRDGLTTLWGMIVGEWVRRL